MVKWWGKARVASITVAWTTANGGAAVLECNQMNGC